MKLLKRKFLQHVARGVMGLALLAVVPMAFAQSTADITITGTIRAGTCSVAAIPDQTLPEVSASEFPASGELIASQKTFGLALTGCSGVTGASINFTGTAAVGDAGRFRNTAASPAPGVGIYLYRTTPPAAGIAPNTATSVTFAGASYTLGLRASLWKLSAATPVTMGAVGTTITANITYR